MVGQLDAISRRLKHNRVGQRRPVERLRPERTLAVDTHALNLADDVKGLVQGFHGRDLDGQMVESDILATIKRRGALIRLPNSEQRRSVREEKGRIGFDTANRLEAECLEEFQRSIKVTDGETNMGKADGQVAGVCHIWFCEHTFHIVPARSMGVSRNPLIV
eukprot:scaffold23146_cov90-Attheya_sp.AAC.1